MEENSGNLIRTLRQKLGMTQEEFAHEIAVTVSTVNRWENAHAAMRHRTVALSTSQRHRLPVAR